MRYENAEKKYLEFLELIQRLADRIDVKGENIELFLFTFGKNLKVDKTETKMSNIWSGEFPESLFNDEIIHVRLNE